LWKFGANQGDSICDDLGSAERVEIGERSIPGADKIILDVSSRLLVNFAYNIS
jgi:hypothetical protein